MAREFDGTNEYYSNAAAVLTGEPLSMGCWFRSNSASANQCVMSIVTASGQSRFQLNVQGGAAGDPVRANTVASNGSSSPASTSTGYSTGVWHHALGVFGASNSRAAYIDGGSKGTDSGSVTVADLAQTQIGAVKVNGSQTNLFDGLIAEAAIWDVALTDAEAAVLGRGYSPLFVRPANLVAYWPLLLSNLEPSLEIDWFGGFGLYPNDSTLGNGPRPANHPRIIYPTRRLARITPPVPPPFRELAQFENIPPFSRALGVDVGGVASSSSIGF